MLSWWTHTLTHLSTPTESTSARASPDGNQRVWVMTCQRWFIDYDKCATLVGGGGNLGEAGNSLYLPPRFDVNPKLLLKKKKSYGVPSWSLCIPLLLRNMNMGIYKIQKVLAS